MVAPVTVSKAAFLMVMPRSASPNEHGNSIRHDEQVAMRSKAMPRGFASSARVALPPSPLNPGSITRNGGHDAGSSIYLPDAIVKGIADGEIALAIKCDVSDVREQSIARFSAITRKGERRRSRHK